VSYSGDANNGPASTSCGDPAETVTVTNPPLSVTGRGHQLRRKVTFNWMVAGGPQPIGFNILAVTQQHKLILMNSQLITSHTGAHYLLVVHHLHMKVDFDDFYVDVKTSGSFVKFGPFIVKG
jgi:hypothetical protein